MKVICQYCDQEAKLVMGDAIYPHRNDLNHLRFYQCHPCQAYVGCHLESGEPFGTLANAVLRRTRMETHKAFDGFWQRNRIRRYLAYGQLAKAMGITRDECHIALFDVQKCKEVQEIVARWEGYGKEYADDIRA